MAKFKLKEYSDASNRSVPFKPLSRLSILRNRVKGLFLNEKTCRQCHTKIKSIASGESFGLSSSQCYCICSRCNEAFHFLCYMEAIGAIKGKGAIFMWPKSNKSDSHYNYAVCPACNHTRSCFTILNGQKSEFIENEVVELKKMNKELIRVGIVGTGGVANACGKIYKKIDGIKIEGFYSEDKLRANEISKKYGAKPFYSLDQFLPDIDVVHIVNKNYQHADVAIKAVGYCKHVIIEKPIDTSIEKAKTLTAIAKKKAVGLHIISNYRFNPFYTGIKPIISDKEKFGELLSINISLNSHRSYDYYSKSGGWLNNPEKSGGGVLLNQSIHLIDYIRWLIGPVVSVSGYIASTRRDINVEDLCVAILRNKDDLSVVCRFTSASKISKPEEIEIIGTKGYLKMTDREITELETEDASSRAFGAELMEKMIKRSQYILNRTILRYSPYNIRLGIYKGLQTVGYERQINSIFASIKKNRIENYGDEAISTLDIILSIYKSAESGKEILLSGEKNAG